MSGSLSVQLTHNGSEPCDSFADSIFRAAQPLGHLPDGPYDDVVCQALHRSDSLSASSPSGDSHSWNTWSQPPGRSVARLRTEWALAHVSQRFLAHSVPGRY